MCSTSTNSDSSESHDRLKTPSRDTQQRAGGPRHRGPHTTTSTHRSIWRDAFISPFFFPSHEKGKLGIVFFFYFLCNRVFFFLQQLFGLKNNEPIKNSTHPKLGAPVHVLCAGSGCGTFQNTKKFSQSPEVIPAAEAAAGGAAGAAGGGGGKKRALATIISRRSISRTGDTSALRPRHQQ